MPDTTTTDTATTTDTTTTPAAPAAIRARFVRIAGEGLSLELDARPLHAYLDLLGVGNDGVRYYDQPPGSSNMVDTYSHRIQPAALLKCGIVRIRLSDVYRAPTPKQTLDRLCASITEAATAVIEHYRPINLRVEVALKPAAVAPAAPAAPADTTTTNNEGV